MHTNLSNFVSQEEFAKFYESMSTSDKWVLNWMSAATLMGRRLGGNGGVAVEVLLRAYNHGEVPPTFVAWELTNAAAAENPKHATTTVQDANWRH